MILSSFPSFIFFSQFCIILQVVQELLYFKITLSRGLREGEFFITALNKGHNHLKTQLEKCTKSLYIDILKEAINKKKVHILSIFQKGEDESHRKSQIWNNNF